MRSFQTFEDAMGRATEILRPASTRYAVTLAANTPKTIDVPTGSMSVLFNATGPFWVGYGMAATVPATDLLDGTAPELSPSARRIEGVATLGLAAASACTVSLSFFQ